MPNLVVMPRVSFWSTGDEFTVSELNRTATSKYSLTHLGFGADARYYFPTDNPTGFFAGGGLAIERYISKFEVSSNIQGFRGGDAALSSTTLGLTVVGGAERPLSDNVNGFAEMRYRLGTLGTFSLQAGITFNLGI